MFHATLEDEREAPLTVTVDANCTDPENDIKSTVIDFGDGFYATATTTHTFVHAGTFSLTVVATDSTGNVSNAASGTVSVSDDPTLFVGVSNGQVKEFDQSGDVINTLNTGRGGSVTGMSFDSVGNLRYQFHRQRRDQVCRQRTVSEISVPLQLQTRIYRL